MVKKLLLPVVIGALVFTLAACGKKDEAPVSTDTEPASKTEEVSVLTNTSSSPKTFVFEDEAGNSDDKEARKDESQEDEEKQAEAGEPADNRSM